MKKFTFFNFLTAFFCLSLFFATEAKAQNLIVNGDFEVGEPGDPVPSWGGFKNRIAEDDITNNQVGQIENGDGSLFQEFDVTPGETYNVDIEYRWLGSGGASNANLTIRIKDADDLPFNLPLMDATAEDGYILNTELDTWHTASFSFEVPSGIDQVRLLMFKPNGNKPLNVDNIVVSTTLSTNSLTKYDFSYYPNPVEDNLILSANEAIDKIEIFNIVGKKINEVQINSTSHQISLNNLQSGTYVLKTYIGNNVGTSKLIKK